MSRITSNPVELHKLSIVDKQTDNRTRDASPTRLTPGAQRNAPPPPSPRRLGLQISLPIESSPVKDTESIELSPVSSQSNSRRDSASSDHGKQDLLYKLAAKEREIVELEQKLQTARKELHLLESHYRSTVPRQPASSGTAQNTNDVIQHWSKRVQRTLDDVNNSPNVIRSKKSISTFFNADQQPPQAGAKGGFFQNLVDKFSEFSVAEDEEEEFDRTQNKQKDDFYLKEKLDYDDEEEIGNEPTGSTLLNVKESRFKDLYRR